ncbi:MAG: hypothetical protein JKY04_08365, partial [Sneathiella sp.]|nr:hypothetical protein [Sneathiella sp.]
MMTSALNKVGIHELWETIGDYWEARSKDDELEIQRREQSSAWMWSELSESLMNQLKYDAAVSAKLPEFEAEVKAGKVSPTAAARELLGIFLAK